MAKKHSFQKMGTKTLHLGGKRKGSLTPAEWQKRIRKTVKDNPLW